MSIAMEMDDPCAHDTALRAWKGSEREGRKDEGVSMISYSCMLGCRSISSRSRPHDLRCSTTAERPHQGSCRHRRVKVKCTPIIITEDVSFISILPSGFSHLKINKQLGTSWENRYFCKRYFDST